MLFSTAAWAGEPVKLCFNHYPPYVIGNESTASVPIGLKVDIARTVFRSLDVPLTITTLPFKRCLRMVEDGTMDGTLPLSQNDERKAYMVFSGAANSQSARFVYRISRFPQGLRWSSFDHISHHTLIINQGSIIDGAMESTFAANNPIMRSPDIPLMVKMIHAGRGDLGATDLLVAQYVIAKSGLSGQLAISEQSIQDNSVYFGLSKKSPFVKLLPAINRELEKMHKDGRMARIMAKNYGD